MQPPGLRGAGQSAYRDWTDKSKPVARRGRKATGLGQPVSRVAEPGGSHMRAGSAFASSTRHIVGVALQAFLLAAIVAALTFATATVVGSAPGGAHSVF